MLPNLFIYRPILQILRHSLYLKIMFISCTQLKPEYDSIIWDPYLKGGIQRIQRSAVCFITRDYKSRDKGCVTNMLKELELPTPVKEAMPAKTNLPVQDGQRAGTANGHWALSKSSATLTEEQSEMCNLKTLFRKALLRVYIPAKSDNYRRSFFVQTMDDWKVILQSNN